MIDVDRAVCSSAHTEHLPTVAIAKGRKRKWADLGVIMTKCLTTVEKRSGLWVRVIHVNIEEAHCCVSFGFKGWMHKCHHISMVSNCFCKMVNSLRNIVQSAHLNKSTNTLIFILCLHEEFNSSWHESGLRSLPLLALSVKDEPRIKFLFFLKSRIFKI